MLEAQIPEYKKVTAEIAKKRENKITLSKQDAHFEEHLQDVLNHILTKQVYGIAITELTAYLSRRSVYCSKFAAEKYSVCTGFKNDDGNIRFVPMKHTWKDGKCIYCGVSKSQYDRPNDLEQHAYEFIHTEKVEDILNMQFDVIVGNPPYQLGSNKEDQQRDKPMYHKFVQQAIKLNPKYLCMIIPARWYTGTWNTDTFHDDMLNDKHIKELHDFTSSKLCFPGVEIKGGVCYFLRDRDYNGKAKIVSESDQNIEDVSKRYLKYHNSDVFIRYNKAIPIVDKVFSKNEASFNEIVSSQNPFGFNTAYSGNKRKSTGDIELLRKGREVQYIVPSKVLRNQNWVNKIKVLMPKAGEGGALPNKILGKPFIAEKGTCCTGTYIVFGPFPSRKEASNAITYVQTRLFRFLVAMRKITQDTNSLSYSFVPMQDFSKPWTDEELYTKYNLSKDEIAYIESMIKPMDLDGDDDGE